jgi:hypothetical protein
MKPNFTTVSLMILKKLFYSLGMWYIPIIPASGVWGRTISSFEASLNNIGRPRLKLKKKKKLLWKKSLAFSFIFLTIKQRYLYPEHRIVKELIGTYGTSKHMIGLWNIWMLVNFPFLSHFSCTHLNSGSLKFNMLTR